MKKKSIRKSIANYEIRIKDHLEKIDKELSRSSPNENIIAYFNAEIRNFKNLIEKNVKRLKKH